MCSYNAVGKWNWNTHGSDWIYQGGPDSTDVKGDPYFNQWEDFDDSPVTWHITEVSRLKADVVCNVSPTIMLSMLSMIAVDSVAIQPVMPLQTEPWLEAVGGGLY